jgi:hypothetical protein
MGLGRNQLDMKKYLYASFFGAFAAILLLGAVGPGVNHNNFTTNVPPSPVVGDWNYSNALVLNFTNYVSWSAAGIAGIDPDSGLTIWRASPVASGAPGFSIGNGLGLWGPTRGAFDLQFFMQFTNATRPGLRFIGAIPTPLTNYFQIEDNNGNAIAYMRSNVFWATTNDFFATSVSTDNTTNTILTITPRDNSTARCSARVVAYNSTAGFSNERIGTFRTTGGVVTQVGSIAVVGTATEDSAFQTVLDTSANTIRLRVAGDTGKTVDWVCYFNIIYWQ